MKTIHTLLLSILLVVASCTCRNTGKETVAQTESSIQADTSNAIYYWKTRFHIGDAERAFMQKNGVRRIYLRFFDVDYDATAAAGPERVIPVATTIFDSPVPQGIEIVPTVFITTRALRMSKNEPDGLKGLAGKITERVKNMAAFNETGPVREMQLDCDWTESLKGDFDALCRETKEALKQDGTILSATIRLHQLRQAPPPVDRGVLMLYNTGALRASGERNSILSVEDVRSYLGGGECRYVLDLDFAYPAFGWGVWFRNAEYKGLLHRTDYSDATRYSPKGNGQYLVKQSHILEGHELLPGDVIRLENSSCEAIAGVKALIKTAFPAHAHRNILYHLDTSNLEKYSDDEIKSMYNN